MPSVPLTSEQLETLRRARNLLDEVIETMEIMADPKTLQAIREGIRDIEAGRTRPFDEVMRELGLTISETKTNQG